jgi:hypothetical protein
VNDNGGGKNDDLVLHADLEAQAPLPHVGAVRRLLHRELAELEVVPQLRVLRHGQRVQQAGAVDPVHALVAHLLLRGVVHVGKPSLHGLVGVLDKQGEVVGGVRHGKVRDHVEPGQVLDDGGGVLVLFLRFSNGRI